MEEKRGAKQKTIAKVLLKRCGGVIPLFSKSSHKSGNSFILSKVRWKIWKKENWPREKRGKVRVKLGRLGLPMSRIHKDQLEKLIQKGGWEGEREVFYRQDFATSMST